MKKGAYSPCPGCESRFAAQSCGPIRQRWNGLDSNDDIQFWEKLIYSKASTYKMAEVSL